MPENKEPSPAVRNLADEGWISEPIKPDGVKYLFEIGDDATLTPALRSKLDNLLNQINNMFGPETQGRCSKVGIGACSVFSWCKVD